MEGEAMDDATRSRSFPLVGLPRTIASRADWKKGTSPPRRQHVATVLPSEPMCPWVCVSHEQGASVPCGRCADPWPFPPDPSRRLSFPDAPVVTDTSSRSCSTRMESWLVFASLPIHAHLWWFTTPTVVLVFFSEGPSDALGTTLPSSQPRPRPFSYHLDVALGGRDGGVLPPHLSLLSSIVPRVKTWVRPNRGKGRPLVTTKRRPSNPTRR